MRLVDLHQRAGDSEAKRAGLTGKPATFDLCDDVKAAE